MICSIKASVGKTIDMSTMVPTSAGYTCLVDFEPDALELHNKKVEAGPRPGAPARFTFTFIPRKAGTTTVHLVEAQPWHGGDVAKVSSYDIII